MKTKNTKEPVFILVKSMTKSEKRQFKLYVGRLGVNSNSKFLNLFNILDKAKCYDEKSILESKIVNKRQLPNLKSHLYKQILISLKLNPSHKDVRSQIREELDFASILYDKGLYKQSLKILDKSKQTALLHDENNLAYEIIELEKLIESQYITRSIAGRADVLTGESEKMAKLNLISGKLSNLSLQLYGRFLKTGYAKEKSEADEITLFFNENLPEFDFKKLGFREKLWLYKSYLWYSFLQQDFKNCYKYSLKWVNLYSEYPEMIAHHPVFYLKGNHYLLESLFFIGDVKRFKKQLYALINNVENNTFPSSKNVKTISFLYINFNKLNVYFMTGDFENGLPLIPQIENDLEEYKNHIDEHHIMVFYYKFASLYFGNSDYELCIIYLEKIISNNSIEMREDLMCFSRLLYLIAHYEAGIDHNFEILLKNTYKFLIKMDELYKVQKELIRFIREILDIYPHDLKTAFKKLYNKLKKYDKDKFERRAFLYLDILSWLESKIENKNVSQIIKEKNEKYPKNPF